MLVKDSTQASRYAVNPWTLFSRILENPQSHRDRQTDNTTDTNGDRWEEWRSSDNMRNLQRMEKLEKCNGAILDFRV
jgi:hypothetical protein